MTEQTVIGGLPFCWGSRTYIMGVINVSPDSFSGDGQTSPDSALGRARQLAAEGADILDVGGESTRPGSEPVSIEEELRRVIPVIEAISGEMRIPLSVDTYKPEVARAAVMAGAGLINDVWGLKKNRGLAAVAAEYGLPLVITANQRDEQPAGIMPAVMADLENGIARALAAGVAEENIIIDPGIGFGKTCEQNLEVMQRMNELKVLGKPVLLGTSRKSFIGITLGLPETDRVEGTAATVAIGISRGADIIRVHDVGIMARVARMADAIVRRV